jgi:hypothetical protein
MENCNFYSVYATNEFGGVRLYNGLSFLKALHLTCNALVDMNGYILRIYMPNGDIFCTHKTFDNL